MEMYKFDLPQNWTADTAISVFQQMFAVISFLFAIVSTENAFCGQGFLVLLTTWCRFWYYIIVHIWTVFKITPIMTEFLHYVLD